MSDEPEWTPERREQRGYVVGATESVLHVLEEFVEQHVYVNHDPDLWDRLSNAILLLQDFLYAVRRDGQDREPPMVVLVPGKPLDPAAIELMAGLPDRPEPLHHMFLPRWEQRGRTAISVSEAATYIVDVVKAARGGAEIVLTLNGERAVRLVPYEPPAPVSRYKPFDPEEVRRYTGHIQPHDRPTVDFVREMRARDRF